MRIRPRQTKQNMSAFAPGTRFGTYEVTELISVGGMGEVYEGRDVQLKRAVALKVLSEARRLDREALERFNREALLLASLNHPNIATVHGLESAGDLQVLVMELVDGETLDDRIARAATSRGLAIDDALDIAQQIAAALDAAHQRGIVHRDLKPSNVKIRDDGTVKVLDFGIAKAFSREGAGTAATTLTTQAGAVIGTPSYMSPEQAAGGAIDQKTDIWAFGCVLFEMLTGQRAFDGDSSSQILARVIERPPDWSHLPTPMPERIRRLLGQCLEKDVRRRRRDAGDIRLEIEQARTEPLAVIDSRPAGVGRRALAIAGAAMLGALATGIAFYFEEGRPPRVVDIVTPASRAPHHFAVSPDSRFLVYVASISPPGTVQGLFLRDLESGAERLIPNTEGAIYPFWSPDNRSIGFFDGENLVRVDTDGGRRITLAPAQNGLGGSWGEDDTILYASSSVVPLFSVPAAGGVYAEATTLDLTQERNHRFPSFLPDGRFLFYVDGSPDARGVYLGSLNAEPPRRLTAADSAAVFLSPDWVAFEQNDVLVARRLDLGRGELIGEPTTLANSVRALPNGYLPFSASTNGVLAYRDTRAPQAQLTWYDSSGMVQKEGLYNGPDLSSDDRYLVYDDAGADSNRDIFIKDLARDGETRGTQLTYDATVEGYPVFSPDDQHLIYEKQRYEDEIFELWTIRPNRPGQENRVYGTADNLIPLDWSADWYLLYRRSDADFLSSDLMALPISVENGVPEPAGEPVAVADSSAEERLGVFHPAGTWVAYDFLDRSAWRSQIFIEPFPRTGDVTRVPTDDGSAPRWSADGSELFFMTADGTIMSSRITISDGELEAGTPTSVVQTESRGNPYNHAYDVTSDRTFLVNTLEVIDAPQPIKLILNWRP